MKTLVPALFVCSLALIYPAVAERPAEPYPKPSIFSMVGNWRVMHHPEWKTCNADVNMFSRPAGTQTNVMIETGLIFPRDKQKPFLNPGILF
jgi:hypothetical protein